MIKRLLYCLIIGVAFVMIGKGQNLIPDPTFDNLSSTECIWPGDVWPNSTYWYVANPTPDWYVKECPPFPGFPYWGVQEGQGEAGFRMDLRVKGFHYSEAIGTPLIGTMEEGKLYYFEMDIRNRGIFLSGFNGLGGDCTINPQKDVRVYTGTDSIFIEVDDLNDGAVTMNAQQLFKFQEDFLASSEESFPQTVGACMVGDPSVKHLAIAPRYGNFEVEPPCMLRDTFGVFNIAYYALDNVHLFKLPEQVDTSVLWCSTESDQFIDLSEVFDEHALKSVTYTWADGQTGAIRVFSEPGVYTATIGLPCGEIPASVTVAYESCASGLFVPNAFSPNGDGINDTFRPFIESDLPLTSYSFKIFDRWGALLFETKALNATWNGYAFGRSASTGVYVWVLEYEIENTQFKEMGEVLIIR